MHHSKCSRPQLGAYLSEPAPRRERKNWIREISKLYLLASVGKTGIFSKNSRLYLWSRAPTRVALAIFERDPTGGVGVLLIRPSHLCGMILKFRNAF